MDKNICAQLYTVRDFCKTLPEFAETVKKVAAIGYKTVQVSGIGDIKAEDIRAVCDEYGVRAVATHRSLDSFLNNFEAEVAFHKTIGSPYAGIGSMPWEYNRDPNALSDFIKKTAELSKRLYMNELIFTYHNHAAEFAKINGRFVLDIIAASTPSECYKFILDTYWIAFAGVDPAEVIKKYSGRIALMHFKDLAVDPGTNNVMMAPVGSGNLDWDLIISASVLSGASYAAVEQDICKGDPFDALAESYNYLTGQGFNQTVKKFH